MNQPAHEHARAAESAPATRERNVVGNWALGSALSSIVLPIALMLVWTPYTRGFGVLEVIAWALMLAIVLSFIASLLGAIGLYRAKQGRRSTITAAWGFGLGLLVLIALAASLIVEGW